MQTSLAVLFIRDLDRLITELECYPDEASLWVLPEGIGNSAGTLALHLCGNLQHFIGAVLCQTGYVRKREEEFSLRDLPRSHLIVEINKTKDLISSQLNENIQLDADYPSGFHPMGDMSTGQFLAHLYGHLNYHLGQINYHRRLALS